ncbi:hypothetical protein [Neobacillus bataviensis]|uniref:hypothetical protein n=1 Tax=Neobacillus bataviensis TaxID=220685 RepID=UPI0002F6261D|nr:hypothetical protein [Neobacillus bataviensis]
MPYGYPSAFGYPAPYPAYPSPYVRGGIWFAVIIVLFILLLIFGAWWWFSCYY